MCTTGDAGSKAIDAVNFHLKPRASPEDILDLAAKARSVLGPNELRKPLINGESAYGEPPPKSPGGADFVWNDPDMQASYVSRYLLLQWSGGFAMSNWYAWDNRGSALWKTDKGLQNGAAAYERTMQWMLGTAMKTPCSQSGSLWSCELTDSKGIGSLVVWDAAQSCRGGHCSFSDREFAPSYRRYETLKGTVRSLRHPSPGGDGIVPVGIEPIRLLR